MMMNIQHNLIAMNANRQFQVNDKSNAKAVEKLSSGYRINRAADDAAGLAISEKMRRQIRGLMQGTRNAQDGVSFVQVADGSMSEVHEMLQRMNELAIKSLNGTCTESDRAALDAEFDHLRTEIDRINYETEYNEQPVFEEHEASFYQIAGNRKWDDNQLHTVTAEGNEMSIHLPDNYTPKDFTLTVPAGVYTTQELIDEIDDAMGRMVPFNPGFVLEYTGKGFCNLNFESAAGLPTEIRSVDGPLSYLLYDSYTGNSSTSLLGTTVFEVGSPLPITAQNNELGFYIESKGSMDFVKIIIPEGEYSRAEIIDVINSELAKNPNCSGVVAKEYGSTGVQITGGADKSITGLKGNMFKLETVKPLYSSVFYDNVHYGSSTGGSSAYIEGNAFYYDGKTAEIDISAANKNNVLRFKVNGAADYTEITIPDNKYTMETLAQELNKQFQGKGLAVKASANYTTSPESSYYLRLASTVQGSGSELVFDKSPGVYGNTYNDLFLNTRYYPDQYSGSTGSQNVYLLGNANLSGGVTLSGSDSLSFTVDGTAYTISNIAGTYTDCKQLVDKLNACLQSMPALSAVKDKIKFENSGNRLRLTGQAGVVQSVNFNGAGQKNDTYKKLFVGTHSEVRDGAFVNKTGSIISQEGTSGVKLEDATVKVTIPSDKRTSPITIGADCNKIRFTVNGSSQTITLKNGTYSNISSLVTEINNQFKNSTDARLQKMSAVYSNGTLTFKSTPLPKYAVTDQWSLSVAKETYQALSGYAWREILGTETKDNTHPYPQTPQPASPATLTTHLDIPDQVTIDGSNCKLSLDNGTDSAIIEIAQGTYNTREDLRKALQDAVDKTGLKGKVTVSIYGSGKLRFSSMGTKLEASDPPGSSFYKDIIMSKRSESKPKQHVEKGKYTDSNFVDPFIIGRSDLTAEPIEIVAGANDKFTFDFTHTGQNGYQEEINVTIPPGVYTGDEIAAALQKEIQKAFDATAHADFNIEVRIGGYNTNVVGANDDTALQIVVKRKNGKELEAGQYVLDGVRGSAAGFIFYKTTGKPKETYVVGTKDLSQGITFKPGQNVLTFSADGVPYQYTFPENTHFTAEEYVKLLNDMFTNGDDNGKKAPLEATIENGALKIAHQAVGSHTIEDIGGSARSVIFLEESGRSTRKPMIILVGAESKDTVEIPRTSVGTCSLAINSLTLSRPKYAMKALNRVKTAINTLSSRRSTYGAIQNRLEHTINNNNNVIENTQASESAIRDADIAHEVLIHAKYEILRQSSVSMLAQANQMQSQALSLLQ